MRPPPVRESELPALPSIGRLLTTLLLALVHACAAADGATDVDRLLRAGEPAAALRLADGGLATDGHQPALRFLRGVALMDLKRDDDAMAAFVALTEDYPELAEPYNNIALLLARAGRLDDARAALVTALRNDPSLRVARRNLGDVELQLAIRAWDAVLDQTPGDAALRRRVHAAREALGGAR